MEAIKTSRSATHYCRLQTSGGLNHQCKMQCGDCKNKKMKHNAAIKVLMKHSEKLKSALEVEEKTIEDSISIGEYEFAVANAANLELEMIAINKSIEELLKS